MTTTITSTIGTGGTYATVAAWWAAIPANLVTADEVHIGQLLDQEHDCTPTITFSGKTVDATRYIELTAAAGASWTDMPSSPMRYGYGARIKTNYDYGIGFFIDAGQVMRLSKFQLVNLGTGYTLDSGASGGGASNLDRLLVEGRAAGNAFAGVVQIGGAFAKQCVFIRTVNYADAPVLVSRSELYGCTIVNLGTTVSNAVVGDYDTGKVVKNCAIFGATNALGGSTTWAASGCVTDDASPPSGAVTAAFSTSTGAKFGNITAGTHDLRTTSGSALISAGVQDLVNSIADAYGTTRKNPPDVGVYETAAPAPIVSANPTSATVTAPATAAFSATVSGIYSGLRWQRQAAGAGAWADVVGGTGSTTTNYTTGATTVSGGSFNSTDKFRLVVDWAGGAVTSTEATLTVAAAGTAPSFSVQPSNQSATVGSTASFSFTVAGSGSLTVQAKKNGTDVGSPFAVTAGVSANYTTPTLLIGDNGASYTFVATGDTAPTATSNAATLTVLQPIATTFSFTLNGGNSLTGLKYAVFDQVTPDLWAAAIKKAANGSSNGSGVVTIDVTGLTARRIGELGSAVVTNSDGTATGGAQAATRKAAYYVGAFS